MRLVLIACLATVGGCAHFPGHSPLAGNSAASALYAHDLDGDGRLSLDEARAAALRRFAVTHANDGAAQKTTARAAYLDSVNRMFAAADPDHEGVLDAKRLSSPAGQQLLLLIR